MTPAITVRTQDAETEFRKRLTQLPEYFTWAPNEVCDDGNTNNNDYCRNDCMAIIGYCGDGAIQPGHPASESCDNATFGEGIGAYCTGDCTGSGPTMTCAAGCKINHGSCGDGNIDYIAGEACDDGNAINGDYCSHPGCQITGYCGDAIIQINEVCDSSTTPPGIGPYCVNDCQTNLGSCGDAKIQGPGYTTFFYGGTLPTGTGWTTSGPENCDTNDPRTASISTAVTKGCSTTCMREGSCGDGVRQVRFEACDSTNERLFLRFNESSGTTATDSSGNGLHGTAYGAVSWTAGKYGNSLDFNGSTTYVEVPASTNLEIGTGLTISAWIRPDVLADHRGIVSKKATGTTAQYTYMAVIMANGRLGFYTPSSGWKYSNAGLISANEWAHVTWAWDGTNVTFYKNGAVDSAQTFVILNNYPAHTTQIGMWRNPTIYAFDGMIDDVKIYSKALSFYEIRFAMHNSKALCRSGCRSDAVGMVDNVSNTSISGWACDPDYPMAPQAQVRLEFYNKNNTFINSRLFSTSFASEQAIQNICGGGANHRWSFDPNDSTLNLEAHATNQPFRVDAYAISKDGAPETDTLIGTGQFTMKQICGDGVIQRLDCTGYSNCEVVDEVGSIETCDDGNSVNTDNCKNNCTLPACGDGVASIHATGIYAEVCETSPTVEQKSCSLLGGDLASSTSGTASCATDCKSWVTHPDKCFKTWTCPVKPFWIHSSSTVYNNVSSYNQKWTASGWSPANDNDTNYDTAASTTECKFKCGVNLTWTGTQCQGDTRTYTCNSPTAPTDGKIINTPSSYSQVWTFNGVSWAWEPADDPSTNYRASYLLADPCTFRCAADRHWWSATNACRPNVITHTCAAKPANSVWNMLTNNGSYPMTWNGSTAYEPADTATTFNEIPHATECRFKCSPGYKWNGTTCFPWSCGDSILMDKGYTNASELVRLYMNEGSGAVAYDSSGNGNNGTVAFATWTSGKFDSGLNFNGTSARVDIPYTPPTNTFTFMAWVKTSTSITLPAESQSGTAGVTDQRYVFYPDQRGTDGGAGVSVGTNGVVVTEHGNAYAAPLAVLNRNLGTDWVHVAVTYNGKQPRIFIDGVLRRTGLTSTMPNVHAPKTLAYGWNFFAGQIDHVRIFSTALSAANIKLAMGELCDNGGNNGKYGYCNTVCDGMGPSCGDSSVTDKDALPANEVARLFMNENSGTTTADASGSSNNGTLIDATWTTGKFGSGINFNGSSSYVNIPDSASLRLGKNMTISTWVKVTANPASWARLVGKSDAGANRNYAIFLHTDGRILFQFQDTGGGYPSIMSPGSISDGTWRNVTATYDGFTMRLYIDGSQVATGSTTATPVTSAGPVRLGWDGAHNVFNGQMDHVRIYARALSAAEVVNSMGEVCDSGTSNLEYGYASAKNCNVGCTWNRYCGDGIKDAEESCERAIVYDANTLCTMQHGSRTYYPGSTGSCNASCGFSNNCLYCGDGNVTSNSGLVLQMPFDSNLTNLRGTNGTGSPASWLGGMQSTSAYFNGSNTVTVANYANIQNLTNMTVSAWVNTSQWAPGGSAVPIVVKGSGYALTYAMWLEPTGKVSFVFHPDFAGCGAHTSTTITGAGWRHITGTFNNSTKVISIYVNGVHETSMTCSGKTPVASAENLTIGHYGTYTRYVGYLDELRIYNRVLNTTEITQDMYEKCDGTNFAGLDCTSFGFVSGSLSCSGCGTIDTSACVPKSCTFSIQLQDSYGDGWNGANVNVFTDGVLRLNSITFTSGSNSTWFNFTAFDGRNMSVTYNSGGTYPTECRFLVRNSSGGGGSNVVQTAWGVSPPTNVSIPVSCP